MQAYHPGRPPLRYLQLSALFLILAFSSCTLEAPPKKIPVTIASVEGKGVKIQVRSSDGFITGLTHTDSEIDLLKEQPDSLDIPVLGIEVYDELDKIRFSDLRDSSLVFDFTHSESQVSFSKQFKNAPFMLNQRVSGNEHGVYLSCRAVCEDLEAPLRSVRFTYLIPVPTGYMFWVPGMDDPLTLDGETAVRFRYGFGDLGVNATGIPLAAFWKPGGPGVSVGVPLEIKTARVSFSIEPEVHRQPPAGSFPTVKDFNYLRVTFDLVGIAPDRPLKTGLWLFSHQDDWRPALKIFVERYPKAFAADPRARELAGVLGDVEPTGVDPTAVRRLLRMNASLAKIGWNFHRYGLWIPPQSVYSDDFTWACQLDTQKYAELSVQQVRFLIDALRIAKMEPVLYSAYNQRCDRELAEKQFDSDIARDELGYPLISEPGRLLMHAALTGPFGRRIFQQQKLMIELYPEAAGFFFDDLSINSVDFAHDDGLTVVHNRPASSLGNTFGRLGPALTEMVHDAGKLVLAAVPSTISACAGVDIFCLEGAGYGNLGAKALMCLDRPAVSLSPSGDSLGIQEIEYRIQNQLIWGVMPSAGLLELDPLLSRAYRPLYLSLKGRQWVLEPHALRLPEGIRGQIFRVPSIERPGRSDLLVTVVRPGVLLADQSLRSGVIVRARAPEAEHLVRAAWTPAARPTWPIPLKVDYQEGELSVELPPFGPAGVLIFSRR